MKLRSLLILPLLLGITSCTFNFDEYSEKTSNVYMTYSTTSVGALTNVPLLEDLKVGEVDYVIKDNEPLIQYVSIKQYESFYASLLKEEVKSEVFENKISLEWAFTINEKVTFHSIINFGTKEFITGGTMSSALKGEGQDSSAYLEGLKYEEKILNQEEVSNYSTFTFRGLDFDIFTINNVHYFPVSLLDLVYSKYSNYSILPVYNDFFLTDASNFANMAQTFFKKTMDGSTYNPTMLARENAIGIVGETIVVSQALQTPYPVMPMYLRKFNRDCFYFMFENYYGLKYTRGIKSMKSYFQNYKESDELLSDNPTIRGQALLNLLGELDDGHTASRTNNAIWGEMATRHYGQLWTERLKLREDLAKDRLDKYVAYDYAHATSDEEREAILDPSYQPDNYAIRYDDNEKIAFFNFDSFAFELDKTVENYELKDTFAYFVRQFEDIKQHHSTVKDVVIDISTNGGGIIIALMKLLALISKDNQGAVYLYSQDHNAQEEIEISVDTNGDGEYNTDDVYGDDFNIYLLSSPYSFSCGNAFPFYAQKAGDAKILGMKSGGGECAVATTMLPTGQFISYSSLTRIGYSTEVDGKYVFEGDEAGAEADYKIDYKHYYDFNYLASLIQSITSN